MSVLIVDYLPESLEYAQKTLQEYGVSTVDSLDKAFELMSPSFPFPFSTVIVKMWWPLDKNSLSQVQRVVGYSDTFLKSTDRSLYVPHGLQFAIQAAAKGAKNILIISGENGNFCLGSAYLSGLPRTFQLDQAQITVRPVEVEKISISEISCENCKNSSGQCPNCHGTGKYINFPCRLCAETGKCSACHGQGKVPQQEVIFVPKWSSIISELSNQ